MFNDVENTTMDENEIILVDDLDYLTNATKIYEKYSRTQKRFLLIYFFILNYFLCKFKFLKGPD